MEKKKIDKEELRKRLSPASYRVTQRGGTETSFSGKYNNHKERGEYTCICCGEGLFSSNDKYDSGTGWPSFFNTLNDNAVSKHNDYKLIMKRVEVRCNSCGSHLGHVFPDGPKPTGERYCINSVALDFKTKP